MKRDFKKHLVVSLVIIFASLAILSGGLYWLSQDIEAQANEINSIRDNSIQQSQSLEILAELKKLAPQAQIYQQKMDRLLPSEDELLDFPNRIDGLARVRQIKSEFTFREGKIEPREDVLGSAPFILTLEGGFENILAFLKDLENNSGQFLAGVNSFEARKTNTSYRVSVDGLVFFK